ncbi:hypothetical protein DV738_g2300, partial [Chaetothyriales sp. CBS 135597]
MESGNNHKNEKTSEKTNEKTNSENNDGRDDSKTDGNNITPKSSTPKSGRRPPELDELPIELATLTDRFIDSLAAKVHSEPPTIDSISERFQDFYASAASSIDIHISALRSRLNRERWPGQAGITTGARPRGPFKAVKDGQQMLTPSEVTEKRKARKLLEYKRLLLEEAVEKRACEKVYDKIWRHKSTMDEVRDEKLRSKTATLALVGIGLKDLGIQLDDSDDSGDSDLDTLDHLQQSLAPARDGLARMNDERSPLGKLKHLQAAHKAIVDTLCTIHPSGSSADEILPTLIYTLITSPVQGINIISNLSFIQRFRAASKIDGEAAYCMTNLEAAIVFLEDVDLASFHGRGHDVGSSTPVDAQPEESERALKPSPPSAAEPSVAVARPPVEASSKALPAASSQRTLSDLLQPITTAPSAARRTAEGSIGTISTTLDNSFRFLLSRLGEKSAADSNAEVVVPKTLDEVRQLVNRPATPDEADAISDTGSPAERDDHSATTPTPTSLPPTLPAKLSTEDKILNLISGGRRRTNSLRDASVDSQRSTTASKIPDPSNTTSTTTPLDAVKTFSASINNPISQIGSAFGGALRSFGTPIPRFLALKSANDLTVGDLPLLLHDYQRLARLLDNLRLMGLEEQEELDEDHGHGQG